MRTDPRAADVKDVVTTTSPPGARHRKLPPVTTATGRSAALLIAVGVVLALPYLWYGPGFVMDDWIWVRNREFGGVLATGGDWQVAARPGAWATYTALFGLLPGHPVLVYVVQTALNIGTSVAFMRLLARFVPGALACAAGLVWLVLPNHSTIDYWGSTANVSLALLLVLVGLGRLVDTARGQPRWLSTGVLLVSGVLCYESVAPAAIVAAGIAWWCLREDDAARIRAASIVVALMTTTAWMAWHSPKGGGRGLFDLGALPAANFGPTVVGSSWVGSGLTVMLAATLAVAAVRRHVEARIAVVGGVVLLVGIASWLNYRTNPLGVGDRSLAVSSFGAAMVWAAAGWSHRRRPAALVVLAALFLSVTLPLRVERAEQYAWASHQALELAAASPVDGVVLLGPCPSYRSYITGLQGPWDATPAVQFLHRDTRLSASYVQNSPYGRFDVGACRRDPHR